MPSIFIWKAEQPNKSQQIITYFSGSDWFLEEYETNTHSFSLIDQTSISLKNITDIQSVLVYHSKRMPDNWVGSDILEIINVPYKKIKSDSFGTLEHIGEWMRFISNDEFELHDTDILIHKAYEIMEWLHSSKSHNYHHNHNSNTNDKCLIKFNLHSDNKQVNYANTYKIPRHLYNKMHDNRTNIKIPIASPLSYK